MYEYIEGKYKGLNKDYVVIDNNGIGYKIFTSGSSICSMPELDSTVKMYIEQIVREDFIGLYGFIDFDELEMFKKLISINGVGSKASLSLLSINKVSILKNAIVNSDESFLIKANGVGKKTAQRIILELKDRLPSLCLDDDTASFDFKVEGSGDFKKSEAIEALLSLGFDEKNIIKVLKNMEPPISDQNVESIIKTALKKLME